MGGLLRCDECGSVSWDVLGLKAGNASKQCTTCDAELKPERRRPGRRPTTRKFSPGTLAERRNSVAPPRT